MNPFDRARRKAMDVRESLVGLADFQEAVSSKTPSRVFLLAIVRIHEKAQPQARRLSQRVR